MLIYICIHWQNNLPQWTKQNSKKNGSTHHKAIHNTTLADVEKKNQQKGNLQHNTINMGTSGQTYLSETIIQSPSPKCNSREQPIKSDAGYEVKLDFQEKVEKGGWVMRGGETKKQHGRVHYIQAILSTLCLTHHYRIQLHFCLHNRHYAGI
jgi:hypothetical protein